MNIYIHVLLSITDYIGDEVLTQDFTQTEIGYTFLLLNDIRYKYSEKKLSIYDKTPDSHSRAQKR